MTKNNSQPDKGELLLGPQGEIVLLDASALVHGARSERLASAGITSELIRQAITDPDVVLLNKPRPNAHDRKPGRKYMLQIPRPISEDSHVAVVAAHVDALGGSGVEGLTANGEEAAGGSVSGARLSAVTVHPSRGIPPERRLYTRGSKS